MDWIKKYRENSDFFLDDNGKYKEIFRLISNSEGNKELSVNRDIKISNILDEKYDDPLEYLNLIIDKLKDKIYKTLETPYSIIYKYKDGLNVSKWTSAEIFKFKDINELNRFVSSKIKEGYKFYPYQILKEYKSSAINPHLILRASFEFW